MPSILINIIYIDYFPGTVLAKANSDLSCIHLISTPLLTTQILIVSDQKWQLGFGKNLTAISVM